MADRMGRGAAGKKCLVHSGNPKTGDDELKASRNTSVL